MKICFLFRLQNAETEIQKFEKKKLKWKETKKRLQDQLNEETQKVNAFVIENQKLLDNVQRLSQRSQNETESFQTLIEEQQHLIDDLQHKLAQERTKSQQLQLQIESMEHTPSLSNQHSSTVSDLTSLYNIFKYLTN